MPDVDIHQQSTRKPATGNPHKVLVALKGSLDLFLESTPMRTKDLFSVESLFFNGVGLVVQVMVWEVGGKEPFGAVAHVDAQHIERPDLRVRPRAYCRYFAMFPIQGREDKIVANLIGLFWEIRFSTCLATLLCRKALRAYTLI